MYRVWILFLSVRALSGFDISVYSGHRQPKFWWWGWGIGIVRFENRYCVGTDGLDGTCYTRRQCRDLGGTPSGTCAGNIGFCCILQMGCGSTSSLNNTYFVNQNYPTPVTGTSSCTFIIQRCNSDVCQVRIDFLTSTLAPPDAMGYCIYDSLRITGGASLVRPICGENSGQHIYLGFNGNTDITISIGSSSSYDLARLWYIKVAQINCDSATRAPDGCLMYYTGLTGTTTSFNYGRSTTTQFYNITTPTVTRLPGTRELANLNYGICVKMAPGYCSIEWSTSSGGSFAVTNSTPSMMTTTGCYSDYVLIPNPVPPNGIVTPDRFCDHAFPTVQSFSKPFVLYVITDDTERYVLDNTNGNDIGNLGFSLSYRQRACNPLTMTTNT